MAILRLLIQYQLEVCQVFPNTAEHAVIEKTVWQARWSNHETCSLSKYIEDCAKGYSCYVMDCLNYLFRKRLLNNVDRMSRTIAITVNKHRKNNKNVPNVKIAFVKETNKLFLINNKITSTIRKPSMNTINPDDAP